MIQLNIKSQAGFIYKQIYHQLKDYILTNKLKTGDKLPSKRELAEREQVSLNTVSNAYDQLLAEGYIYSVERLGYFVEDIAPFKNRIEETNYFPDNLRETDSDLAGWLSLSHNKIDLTDFPFKDWLNHQQITFKENRLALQMIPHLQGPLSVRKTIARMLLFNRGVKCEPEQIILGAGTQGLLKQLIELFPKETVIGLENPGYPRFHQLFKDNGNQIELIDLDQKGVSMTAINQINPNLLVITPSHQFPTGVIMPVSRRIDILNWALQDEKRYIIEDDYDSEFKYETDNIPSLQSLDKHDTVIYNGTFSKTLFAGMRISYMVLPVELLKKYQKVHRNLMCTSNMLELFTLSRFIEQGDYMSYVRKMNYKYDLKRKKLIKALENKFQNQIQIHSIPAGLHFIAEIKTKITYEVFTKKAIQQKLELSTLSYFKQTKAHSSDTLTIILGFAHIAQEDIEEAVARLYQIINSFI